MSTLPFTAEQAVAKARSQEGITELPRNSNRTPYGQQFGLNGVPWCAIFVWWTFRQLGTDLRTLTRDVAYTPAFAQAAARAGWAQIAPQLAQPGDIVFYDFPPLDRIEHTGMVIGNRPSQRQLIATEANTSMSSDANGGEVMARTRNYSLIRVIYRPPYAVKAPARAAAPRLRRELSARRVLSMRGADVKAVQRLVGARQDGVYGSQTARAVAVWQDRHNLPSDGVFGRQSARAAGWVFSA